MPSAQSLLQTSRERDKAKGEDDISREAEGGKCVGEGGEEGRGTCKGGVREGSWKPGAARGGASAGVSSCRQEGQVLTLRSHGSTHAAWKSCAHGKNTTSCRRKREEEREKG
jgi:hypothetical protein